MTESTIPTTTLTAAFAAHIRKAASNRQGFTAWSLYHAARDIGLNLDRVRGPYPWSIIELLRCLDRISRHKNRARRARVENKLTAVDWLNLVYAYDCRCLYCNGQFEALTLTIDHIVPISKGGHNSIENIQPLCQDCHYVKSRWEKHGTYLDLRLEK